MLSARRALPKSGLSERRFGGGKRKSLRADRYRHLGVEPDMHTDSLAPGWRSGYEDASSIRQDFCG